MVIMRERIIVLSSQHYSTINSCAAEVCIAVLSDYYGITLKSHFFFTVATTRNGTLGGPSYCSGVQWSIQLLTVFWLCEGLNRLLPYQNAYIA